MRKTRAEIKAELLAKYEAMLDDVLREDATAEGLTLVEIEDLALHTRARVGEQVTVAMLENRRGQSVPGPCCPQCGQEMQYKGEKHRYLRTRSGDVEVERAYYYCPACGQGLFPPR